MLLREEWEAPFHSYHYALHPMCMACTFLPKSTATTCKLQQPTGYYIQFQPQISRAHCPCGHHGPSYISKRAHSSSVLRQHPHSLMGYLRKHHNNQTTCNLFAHASYAPAPAPIPTKYIPHPWRHQWNGQQYILFDTPFWHHLCCPEVTKVCNNIYLQLMIFLELLYISYLKLPAINLVDR